MREFKEETNIYPSKYDMYENIIPFNESYTGSNNIQYKNIYYLAMIKNDMELKIDKNTEQIHEVKNIKWINKDNYKEYVRDYSNYKIELLNEIFKFLDSDYLEKIIK